MIIFLLFDIVSSFVGDQACNLQILSNTCESLGYCYWDYTNSLCKNEDCYKVDEIAACRNGGVLYNTVCKSLEMSSYHYTTYGNVCNELTDANNELIQHYIRYQYPQGGYADKSSDGVTLTLWNTLFPQYGYINSLYTISILKQNMLQLDQTLDIYLKYLSLFLFDTNSYNLYQHEIAISQMFTMLRDDTTLLSNPKKLMIQKVWTITDNLIQRYKNIGSNYTGIYPLYTICFNSLSYLKVTLTAYKQKVLFQWNQYPANGYVQILGYDLNQFGFDGLITQVYEFNVYDIGHNSQTITYAIYYTIDYDITQQPVYLAIFDRSGMTIVSSTTITCTYDNIITFQSTCLVPGLTSNTKYFLTHKITTTCNTILKRYKCKQPICQWNDSTNQCQ